MRLFHRLALAVMLIPVVARAECELVVAFDAQSLPTMYLDAKGEAAGIYPAIVKKAFEKIGRSACLVGVPFRRVTAGLSSGRFAAGAVVKTAGRELKSDFSKPYFVESVSVYQRAGSRATFQNMDDFRGRKVGVILGWAYGTAIDDSLASGLFSVDPVDSDVKNFQKLMLGRLDFAVATSNAGALLRRDPEFASIIAAPNVLTAIPIHLAINKKVNHSGLLHRFDAAIRGMEVSGELKQIVQDEENRAVLEWQRRQARGQAVVAAVPAV